MEAWFNYIALQQPNYEAVFRCTCEPGAACRAVLGDGIVLGTKHAVSDAG